MTEPLDPVLALVAELYLERFGGPPLRPTTRHRGMWWQRSKNAGTGWRPSGWRLPRMRRGMTENDRVDTGGLT